MALANPTNVRTCTNRHDAAKGPRQIPELEARSPASSNVELFGKDVRQVVEELDGHVKGKYAGGHGCAHEHGSRDGGGLRVICVQRRIQCVVCCE
jgi:hypothetical protein